jgi:hypothetical protein
MQTWITSLLGVISERFPNADEKLLFIRGMFIRRRVSVKGIRALFGLLAYSRLAQADADQPRTGRYLTIGVAMEQVRGETWVAFERRLDRAGVPVPQRPDYRKWVRFYLDFCHNAPKNPRGAKKARRAGPNWWRKSQGPERLSRPHRSRRLRRGDLPNGSRAQARAAQRPRLPNWMAS